MLAKYLKHTLHFRVPGRTSRGVLTQKECWYLILQKGDSIGIGECSPLWGLSPDSKTQYEKKLNSLCTDIQLGHLPSEAFFRDFPSINFGFEQAQASLNASSPFELFLSDFTKGKDSIPINGLIWMGEPSFMKEQIAKKIEQGFNCLKLKIGALDFDLEWNLLNEIRKQFSKTDLELRVDANGAFKTSEALRLLQKLAELDIHSIEQPIKPGQWDEMARLCDQSPVPIALDEELIGITDVTNRKKLIQIVNPDYLILKPSLLGGWSSSKKWIELAQEAGIGWWITSALESNVGLNAIAQWTYALNTKQHQGLGTGSLYSNNIPCPLEVSRAGLWYRPGQKWNLRAVLENNFSC